MIQTAPQQSPTLRILLGMALITLAYFLMIDPAFAAAASGSAYFYCSGGHGYGTLYDTSVITCPTTLGTKNIFTFLVCNMEHLSGNLMGNMYCSIVRAMLPAVMGMLTLAVLFFGMGFTIGVIPATARDFQLFLIKIVFVFVFATKSDYLIGFGYRFLVDGIREGVAVGLSAMFTDIPTASGGSYHFASGVDVYGYMDGFLNKAMHFATDYVGAKDHGTDPCQNALFAVLAIMAVAFPPVFYIGVMIIFRVALTFLRAVFGYLYSIVGIVFLLTMAPFFLSFALFRITKPYFEKWLGYLVTFAMQMVILFAFLGFILTINVKHITNSLTDIIMQTKESHDSMTMLMPWQYCTICEFEVVDKDGHPYKDQQYGLDDAIKDGTLRCKTDASGNKVPLSVFTATAPPTDQEALKASIQGSLLKFASTALLSLLVLAYLVEYILNYVPAFASFLASGVGGASYAPQLGGGDTIGQKISLDMPGGTMINTFEQGFTDGYIDNIGQTSVVSTISGFKKASERLLLGGGGGDDTGTGRNDPGLVDGFFNFMINPQNNDYGDG